MSRWSSVTVGRALRFSSSSLARLNDQLPSGGWSSTASGTAVTCGLGLVMASRRVSSDVFYFLGDLRRTVVGARSVDKGPCLDPDSDLMEGDASSWWWLRLQWIPLRSRTTPGAANWSCTDRPPVPGGESSAANSVWRHQGRLIPRQLGL